jgi:predicted MFS family arabinose efflux permease
VKRPFSFFSRPAVLVGSGTALIAATYGLVRLAYGLFLPDVQQSLSLDDATAGWIASGSSVFYCVGALVGFAVAPTRPRSTVVLAAAAAGLGAAGMAASTGPLLFGVAAVLGSAGPGLASPALVRIVQRDTAPARVGRAQSVVNSGTGPGLVVAGALALVLLPDWRTAWWAAVLITLLSAAVVLLADGAATVRAPVSARSPERVPGPHPTPGGPEPAHPGTAASPRSGGSLPPRPWFVAHRRPVLVALLLGTGSAAVWTYGRALLVDAGAPARLSVVAWVALGVGGAAVAVTARPLGRLSARQAWTVTAGTVAVATLGLGLVPQAPPVALACCALFGWGYTAATGALITWTTELDADRAAAGTSVLFVVLVLGQALGAAAAGTAVRTIGTGPVFVGASVVVALGVVAALGSRRGSRGCRRSPEGTALGGQADRASLEGV